MVLPARSNQIGPGAFCEDGNSIDGYKNQDTGECINGNFGAISSAIIPPAKPAITAPIVTSIS